MCILNYKPKACSKYKAAKHYIQYNLKSYQVTNKYLASTNFKSNNIYPRCLFWKNNQTNTYPHIIVHWGKAKPTRPLFCTPAACFSVPADSAAHSDYYSLKYVNIILKPKIIIILGNRVTDKYHTLYSRSIIKYLWLKQIHSTWKICYNWQYDSGQHFTKIGYISATETPDSQIFHQEKLSCFFCVKDL